MNSKTTLFEVTVETSFLKKKLDFITGDQQDPLFDRQSSDDEVPMISSQRPSGFLTAVTKKPIATTIPNKHPNT